MREPQVKLMCPLDDSYLFRTLRERIPEASGALGPEDPGDLYKNAHQSQRAQAICFQTQPEEGPQQSNRIHRGHLGIREKP